MTSARNKHVPPSPLRLTLAKALCFSVLSLPQPPLTSILFFPSCFSLVLSPPFPSVPLICSEGSWQGVLKHPLASRNSRGREQLAWKKQACADLWRRLPLFFLFCGVICKHQCHTSNAACGNKLPLPRGSSTSASNHAKALQTPSPEHLGIKWKKRNFECSEEHFIALCLLLLELQRLFGVSVC